MNAQVAKVRETDDAITHIRECLSYDPQGGLFTWLMRPRSHFKSDRYFHAWNANYAGTNAGSIRRDGRVDLNIDGMKWRAHRVAWAIQTGAWPSMVIDHIDRDHSNNAFSNLRECTLQQNQYNRVASKTNTTGLKGVAWLPKKQRFRAAIRINGKQTHLGLFPDAESAHVAYRAAADKHHGAFANYKVRSSKK